jgi:hypothetical protein
MWSESERTAILVLSSFGAVFNNALYLSQIPMLLRIRKEGDSTRYPFLPSLTLMVSHGARVYVGVVYCNGALLPPRSGDARRVPAAPSTVVSLTRQPSTHRAPFSPLAGRHAELVHLHHLRDAGGFHHGCQLPRRAD